MKKNFTRLMLMSAFSAFFGAFAIAQNVNTLTVSDPAVELEVLTPLTWGSQVTDLSGAATFIDDGVVADGDPRASVTDACDGEITGMDGKIALIDRGVCAFVDKALAAQNAGAIAVVVCNDAGADDPEAFVNMAPDDPPTIASSINIVVTFTTLSNCELIRTAATGADIEMTLSYVAPPCTAEYDETVVWGAEPGQGDFDGGLNGWTTQGITDEVYPFEYTATATSPARNFAMESPTACNGAVVFDFENITDLSGLDWDPNDPASYLQWSANLTSPTIDLSGVNNPLLEFYQFYIGLNGEMRVGWSIDGGETYQDSLITTANVLTGSSQTTVLETEFQSLSMPQIANQPSVKLRFSSIDNDFYFFMVDDIVIKDLLINDAFVNDEWYAKAVNYKTPASQVQEIPFMTDIFNAGAVDVTDINLNVQIQNSAGEVLHEDNLDYGTIPAGGDIQNQVLPDTYTPPAVVGTYTGTYTMTNTTDGEDPSNNSISYDFEITEDEFAKIPSEAEMGSAYLGARATPNTFYETHANHYYMPNGDGWFAISTNVGLVIAEDSSPGFVSVNLFQWIDTNEDGVCDAGERIMLSDDEITIGLGDLTAEQLRDYEVKFTSIDGEPIALENDANYLVSVSMRPINATGEAYRILASSHDVDLNFSQWPTTFAMAELGFVRWGYLQGTGSDDSALDIENRILNSTANWLAYLPLKISTEPVGTNDLNEQLGVSVFPNPTTDKVFIQLDLETSSDDVVLQLNTVDGKMVKAFKYSDIQSAQLEMDVNDVPTGMYNLVIKTDDGFITKQLMVNK